MWPFSKSKNSPPSVALPHQTLEAGILAVAGMGVHMAVQYATMLGFEHEVLNSDEAINRFLELVQQPPHFTDDGIARAVRRVTSSVDIVCQGPSFDSLVYGIHQTDNEHLKPVLELFREAVRRFGAARVFAASDFDLGAFLTSATIERRQRDLAAIYSKLDEKRPYLAPLLMRARAKGRNKYGDTDYGEFFAELIAFLRTYFNAGNLCFFYTYYPLTMCLHHVQPWLTTRPTCLPFLPTASISSIGARHALKNKAGRFG